MKFALSLLVVATLTACGGGSVEPIEATVTFDVKGIPSTTTPTEPRPATCIADLYGDSIMNGFELADTPAMIIKRLRPKYTVVNHAVNGQALVNRVPAIYNEQRTGTTVVAAWGVNDSAIPNSAALYEQTLRDFATYMRAEGRKVIFTGLTRQDPDYPAIVAYDLIMAKVARELNVPFADYHNMPFSPSDIVVSNGHPSQAYTLRNTLKLIEVMDAAQPECK